MILPSPNQPHFPFSFKAVG